MLIRLIEFQKFDPYLNMAIDEAISMFVRQGKTLPTLRFYGWREKAVTIGEFQKIEEINHDFCIKNNIPVIRRPTGGKGILHGNDITYSFSARKEGIFGGSLFQAYRILGKIFAKAFLLTGIAVEIKEGKKFGNNKSSLCFAVSCFGEICFKNRKIMGSAQKRWIDGFLQQGTIPVTVDRRLLKKIFFSHPEDAEKISGIKELYSEFDREIFQENVKKALLEEGFEVVPGSLQKEESELARFLLKNYQLPDNKIKMKQIQPY